jgi:hypothetical protein
LRREGNVVSDLRRTFTNGRKPVVVSALAYTAITIVMGRQVLASLASSIASDPGDPLLTAAILTWNATHLPWSHGWYQFPIFYPTPDALALSEHLLGVSLIAAPIQWLTGSLLVSYNLTVLLSYPICGLAMFALVRRLTNSTSAAFLAGLAYAFAPYRASHLPHIQMLMSFGMPLALLGLHEYLESRRGRWLVLFGLSWLVQGAANGYYLVYFTGVVVLWVAWFMAARGRWRDVAAVAGTLTVAAVPLVPILYRYVSVQRGLGLSRGIGEIAVFSADIGAVLCAPDRLTFWGWLRIACWPEGELFPGTALVALCIAGAIAMRSARTFRLKAEATKSSQESARGFRLQAEGKASRLRVVVLRIALVVALLYGAIAVFTFVWGPWRMDFPWRASASSANKPASVTLFFLLVSIALSRRLHDTIRRGSAETFYLLCAVACWLLTWGPFPRLFGETVLYQAPYAWFARLPGGESLRAPSRLWMMSVLCLVVFMGLGVARLLGQRTKRAAAILTVVAALGLGADGFTTIRAAVVPPAPLVPPTGQTVLFLPIGQPLTDISAVYHSVTQRYRSINGYSGYEPPYYEALRMLSDMRDPQIFAPFVARGELHVLVGKEDVEMRTLVTGQSGARLVLEGPIVHYRVPARTVAQVRIEPIGARVPVQTVEATCSPKSLAAVIDNNPRTRWACRVQSPDQTLIADLGAPATVGTIVHALGSVGGEFPRHLVIETSVDGATWTSAWDGSPAVAVLHATIANPLDIRAVIEFPARPARYVRLRQLSREGTYAWSLAELEVWSGQ